MSAFQVINTFSTQKITTYLITTPFNSCQTQFVLNDKGKILMKRNGAHLSRNIKSPIIYGTCEMYKTIEDAEKLSQ